MLLECLQFWWYFQRHYCLLFLSNTYALNYDVLNLASLLGLIPDSEILVDLPKFKSSYHGWWQRSSASRVISHVSTGLIHGYSLLLIPKFSFLGFSDSVYPYSYSPYSSLIFSSKSLSPYLLLWFLPFRYHFIVGWGLPVTRFLGVKVYYYHLLL